MPVTMSSFMRDNCVELVAGENVDCPRAQYDSSTIAGKIVGEWSRVFYQRHARFVGAFSHEVEHGSLLMTKGPDFPDCE
jgi:hypothetical protein